MAVCSFVILLSMLVVFVQSSNHTTPAPAMKKAVVPVEPRISNTFVIQVRKPAIDYLCVFVCMTVCTRVSCFSAQNITSVWPKRIFLICKVKRTFMHKRR